MLLKVLFTALVTFAVTQQIRANEPPCEIYNYDTDKCELYVEQNLSLNPKWREWYNDKPLDGELILIKD